MCTDTIFSPDDKLSASILDDIAIQICESRSGNLLHVLTGHSDSVSSICFSPCGNSVLSASQDKSIKEWDVKTGKCIRTLVGHITGVHNAVYSADMLRIISFDSEGTKEWDRETCKVIQNGYR